MPINNICVSDHRCLQCLQDTSSNWRKTSMIWAPFTSLSNVLEDISSKCLLTIERSHRFLDAQLQLQPIQPGEHGVCELWTASVCHHINNGRDERWLVFCGSSEQLQMPCKPRHQIDWRHMISHDWCRLELVCRPDMTETCLSWWHVADMTPTCRRHVADMSPTFPTKQTWIC